MNREYIPVTDKEKQMRTYIVDIDGTLANTNHRIHHLLKSPKDWKSWHEMSMEDDVHWELVDILKMAIKNNVLIVLCTGRDEVYRKETELWLTIKGIPYDYLYMREKNDRRDDDIVKLEMLNDIKNRGFNPVLVFEDRDRVVKMWREQGIRCYQVAPGDF